MTAIKMRRSFCKLASVYVIAGVSLSAEVNLGARVGPGFRLEKPGLGELGPKKPGIAELGTLVGPLSFAMVPLPYAMALLGVKNSSSLLRAVKLREGFLQQVAILK